MQNSIQNVLQTESTDYPATLYGNLLKVRLSASEFEQLKLRLVSLYQDTDKASAAFEKFRQIAAKTPATLMAVVEAGASFKAFGLEAEDVLEFDEALPLTHLYKRLSHYLPLPK